MLNRPQVLQSAAAAELPIAVHAGGGPGTAHNISTALELGAKRIAHGLAMASDPMLLSRVIESGRAISLVTARIFLRASVSCREMIEPQGDCAMAEGTRE